MDSAFQESEVRNQKHRHLSARHEVPKSQNPAPFIKGGGSESRGGAALPAKKHPALPVFFWKLSPAKRGTFCRTPETYFTHDTMGFHCTQS
jgi:hypothetical protein